MSAKRGPKAQPWVDLRTTISPEMDRSLTAMVELTGVAKAALIRRALAGLMAELGAVPADRPYDIPAASTHGRLAAHKKGRP